MIVDSIAMERDTGMSLSNEKRPLEGFNTVRETKTHSENGPNALVPINHAAIAWQECRSRWTGGTSQRSKMALDDPIISWSMTYEELLSTNEPFAKRIPLREMVDFLVDIWHDDGLFD
ncbi:uncharacterized protein LOC116011139 [Ipomoea triloba]|uniref:uncharacterized protein LOC116011139 n=1 Tax=Ipomoea triloba TaxID=35885 RepID=UPI00125CD401|nr:uncharacterized protein LOC116011139 [Ipomoea triloba]XP_031106518.1 uncharacterized protein LOC116011139 [Ipomoea triloba]